MNHPTFAETIIAILADLEQTQRFVNNQQSANPKMSEQQLQVKLQRYRASLLAALTPIAAQDALVLLTAATTTTGAP